MTSKDYVKFARLLREIKENGGGIGWQKLEWEMLQIFKEDNRLFDHRTFKAVVRGEPVKGEKADNPKIRS